MAASVALRETCQHPLPPPPQSRSALKKTAWRTPRLPVARRRVPGGAGRRAAPVRYVAVIGGGTMGAGITVSALNASLTVTMVERDASHRAWPGNVEKVYDSLIARAA